PRFQKVAESAMQVLNVGTTIPTLAILALAMSFLGIGTVPAVFGLTIASLLPIVRNTYIGLKEVPAHLKEAASGIGMTE
ncbi:ABC transporter permease subunit, partial [Vibrio parahaemolyticus]